MTGRRKVSMFRDYSRPRIGSGLAVIACNRSLFCDIIHIGTEKICVVPLKGIDLKVPVPINTNFFALSWFYMLAFTY